MDDEACATLMSFAAAESGSRASPPSPPLDDDGSMFPVAKISAIMKRALPPGAFVSKDAKRAVQRCVCEFICFLTSEASDRGGKAQKIIESEDILHAFRHLGFHQYSDLCQSYMDRYRSQSIQSEAAATSPRSPLSRRRPRAAMAIPIPMDGRTRPTPATAVLSATDVSALDEPQRKLPRCDPGADIHVMKSLYQVSIEVASSLVYAWSSPILETALFLAASPAVTPLSGGECGMSPMFLSRLQSMSMMSPAMLPEQALGSAIQPMWLSSGQPQGNYNALQNAARRGITVENFILQNEYPSSSTMSNSFTPPT